MEADDPHGLDLRRRRAVQAAHASRHSARLRTGPCSMAFVALRPSEGGTVPCRIDVFRHGIEAGQGYLPHLMPAAGQIEDAEAICDRNTPLHPLDRASALRVFGLAGTGPGELVRDLGDALMLAWDAEGLGGRTDREELVATARSWEAERIAQSGLSEIRALFPASFAEAAGHLAPPGKAGRAAFGDYTFNMLFRDEGLCALVAALGGLHPLAVERWDEHKRMDFGSPAGFVHEVMRRLPMPGSHAITAEESGWLFRAFEKAPSTHVTEDVAAGLVSYRRALRFQDLGAADTSALCLVLAFAGLAGTKSARRDILELMGDMGSPEGLPYSFMSGLKRHQDATGLATGMVATRLATDAYDLWDTVWNAVGAQVAMEVDSLRRPGVLPLLLWDARDPGIAVLMDGVRLLAKAAACKGMGSEGLLANAEAWVRAGRPGHEGNELPGFRRLRTFREIEFYRGRAGIGYVATLDFVREVTGVDLRQDLHALAEEVAALGVASHERSARQGHPGAAVGDEASVEAHAASPDGSEPDRGADGSGGPASSGPGSWLRRASTLGQALTLRRNA